MKTEKKVKIYTKTGDNGETSLFGGNRLRKDSPRVEAYGTVDELNASFGTAASFIKDKKIRSIIENIQNDLFEIGAELADPQKIGKNTNKLFKLNKAKVLELEKIIDQLDSRLPTLKSFIIPGGTTSSSLIQVSRSITRRAERRIISLSRKEKINPDLLVYMNRLSDLLFVIARQLNKKANVKDIIWKK